jgi:myo-inositol catabolism protein IolC
MNIPVYLLAADHRWQWGEWCDSHAIDRSRIGEAKALALDGLRRARARSHAARQGGALLIDQQYGADTLARARAEGLTVGTPVEKPGVFPLEWTADPFWRALPGDFAKVLIRFRPEWSAESRNDQFLKLRQLAGWCKERRMPLLLEVLISRKDEPEEEFGGRKTARPCTSHHGSLFARRSAGLLEDRGYDQRKRHEGDRPGDQR